jgi:hypothetical protein
MSIRDISAIMKEEEARRHNIYKDQQQQKEISSKAYKLLSEGKRPVEVAIALYLPPSNVSTLYIGYWRLKRLHKLNLIYI